MAPRLRTIGLVLLAATSLGCVGPGGLFEADAGNACSPSPSISPSFGAAIYGVGTTYDFVACFAGDSRDPQGVAAIQWSSRDSSIASVSPVTGPRTTVRGVSVGRTLLRALIKGTTVEVPIVVCQSASSCPP